MHLVTCACPQDPLENAPRTALLADAADTEGDGTRWECFWSGQSDEYFVRCTKGDGVTEWFRVEDDVATLHLPDTRVVELRPPNRRRVSLIVARASGGRHMLVGTARRTKR